MSSSASNASKTAGGGPQGQGKRPTGAGPGGIGLAEPPTQRARRASEIPPGLHRAELPLWDLLRAYDRRDNPCDAVEAPTPPRAAPSIFTVRQTARCLVFLRRRDPRLLAWFLLSTLCGLRPEEAEQTTWDAVQIDNREAHIRVEAQTSKVRQRRIVTPLPAAVAWLKIARDAGSELPLSSQVRRTAIRRLRDALHWEAWPKDITRHTAASYWLALDGNLVHIAEQLGHSVDQLKAHYKALVTRVDAERFWRLIPRGD